MAETTSTAAATDLAETADSAAPFDVCQLSPIQQLFLCDQAAKYRNLSYRLNFIGYTYEKCFVKWPSLPKFFWFQCPPLISTNENGKPAVDMNIILFLSGSDQPATVLTYSFFSKAYPILYYPSAWMESIDLEILKKVEGAPDEFGLGDVDALISKSLQSETPD